MIEDNFPLVTCIITTHNRLHDLKRAVDTVLNQTYPNIELIVVDDYSNDGTREWLMNLDIPNLNFVRNKKSLGGNKSRNIGLHLSNGSYIAFLDDDDEWKIDKITKQFEEFMTSPNIGLVYTGFNKIVNGKKRGQNIPDDLFKGNLEYKIFERIITNTSTIMIKKEILKKTGGFDENLKFWQEYEFMIRVAQYFDISFVKEPLVNINIDTRSKIRLSNKYDEWENSVTYIHQKHKSLIEKLSKSEKNEMKKTYLVDSVIRLKKNRRWIKYFQRLGKLVYISKNPKWFYLVFK